MSPQEAEKGPRGESEVLFAIPCGLAFLDPVAALAADGLIMASFLLSDATADSVMMRVAGVDG
jgi:hypothetical protein